MKSIAVLAIMSVLAAGCVGLEESEEEGSAGDGTSSADANDEEVAEADSALTVGGKLNCESRAALFARAQNYCIANNGGHYTYVYPFQLREACAVECTKWSGGVCVNEQTRYRYADFECTVG